jgi:hypothetical protein
MGGIDSRGRPSLFGLKPYELQNLSFQINDIITQLASGTSLSQTMAQQSGQLIQIFPRSATRSSPRSRPARSSRRSRAIGLLIEVLHTPPPKPRPAADVQRASSRRTLTARSTTRRARGSQQGARPVRHQRRGRAGVTRELLARRLRRQPDPEARRVVEDLADVLGIKVTDAAKQVAEAFSGGYDSIKKLDEGTNFLTASQREHIKVLFEQGDAEEARSVALEDLLGEDGSRRDEDARPMVGSDAEASARMASFISASPRPASSTRWATPSTRWRARPTTSSIRCAASATCRTSTATSRIFRSASTCKRGGAGIFGPGAIDLFSGSNAQKDEAELNR